MNIDTLVRMVYFSAIDAEKAEEELTAYEDWYSNERVKCSKIVTDQINEVHTWEEELETSSVY